LLRTSEETKVGPPDRDLIEVLDESTAQDIVIEDGADPPLSLLLIGLEYFSARAGGLNRYAEGLLGALRHRGVGARYLAVGGAAGRPDDFQRSVDATKPLPSRLFALARAARGEAAFVDVIDVHFALHGFAVLAAVGRKRPYVVHFQGPWADESALQGAGPAVVATKRLMERSVYRRASAIVVLSQAFRRILVEDYGVVPWRIEVLAPGVDLDAFHDGGREDARRRFGVGAEFLAVTVRRLVPRMGHDVLLDAWAQLVARHPDRAPRLLIAGAGPDREQLEERAARLGLQNHVEWLGPIDDRALCDLYRAADVSVVPSVALEGFGLVVLESLASGTPVIASDIGGLPEALDGLHDGLVVRPGDADALAARLEEALIGSRPLPARAECRRHAERYNWDSVARGHMQIYRDAVRPSRRTVQRVVYLSHTADLSARELAFARTVAASGATVDVHVILGEDGPLVNRLQRQGTSVEVLPLPEAVRGLYRAGRSSARRPLRSMVSVVVYSVRVAVRLRRMHPDVVRVNTLEAVSYSGIAARLARVDFVRHIEDTIDLD
jgi:glycosyltransferase involved in cell wall biosynthesis